jgi:hypothetical protein
MSDNLFSYSVVIRKNYAVSAKNRKEADKIIADELMCVEHDIDEVERADTENEAILIRHMADEYIF